MMSDRSLSETDRETHLNVLAEIFGTVPLRLLKLKSLQTINVQLIQRKKE